MGVMVFIWGLGINHFQLRDSGSLGEAVLAVLALRSHSLMTSASWTDALIVSAIMSR